MNHILFIGIGLFVLILGVFLTFITKRKEERSLGLIISLFAGFLISMAPNLVNTGIENIIESKFSIEESQDVPLPSQDVLLSSEGIKIGDTIEFGSYEQDNNASNGTEVIEWEVLDVDGDRAFVISEFALDCQKYNSQLTSVTWETCSLRQWLNSIFYYAAFSAEERELIETVSVTADPNPEFKTNPGVNTSDKIFLLSIDEAITYFTYDSERLCGATQYAIAQGAYVKPDTAGCWWWLRTPGAQSIDAASINSNGTVDYDDGRVDSPKGAVRPVMWIKIM